MWRLAYAAHVSADESSENSADQIVIEFVIDAVTLAPVPMSITRGTQEGSTIIEQALVYPILLVIILGAADITRIFQAHAVLDQGLRSALRCLTPASGDCTEFAPRHSEDRFDVYRRLVAPTYRAQEFHYSATARWLGLPLHQIDRAQAAVIESVRYSRPQYQYQFHRELFRPHGSVFYALQTRAFPNVDLAPDGAFVPLVKESPSAVGEALPAVRVPVSDVWLRYSTDARESSRTRAEVSFTVSRESLFGGAADELRDGERCFLRRHGVVDFSMPCDSAKLFPDRSTKFAMIDSDFRSGGGPRFTYLMVDVRGMVRTRNGAEGAVELSVSQRIDGRMVSRRLGGRRLSGSGVSNFVPRGAPTGNYSRELLSRYGVEVEAHQAIAVAVGIPVTLTFTLISDYSNAQALEWRAREISIFTPQYRIESASVRCDQLISRADFELSPRDRCSRSSHAAGVPRLDTVVLAAEAESVEYRTLCATDTSSGLSSLAEQGVMGFVSSGVSAGAACGESRTTVACPENRGLPGISLVAENESRELCGLADANAICPLPAAVDRGSACWKIVSKEVPVPESARWVQRSCLQDGPRAIDLPAELRHYPSLSISSSRLEGEFVALYTNGVEPQKFVDEHSEYRCAEIEEKIKSIDSAQSRLKPESLFFSNNALGANYREKLFSDAQRHFADASENLDSRAYFEAKEEVRSVLLKNPPKDSGQPYWIDESAPAQWEKIASSISEGVLPAICSRVNEVCRLELSSQSMPIPENVVPYSAATAQQRAFAAIDAALPGLTHGCTERSRGCATIAVADQYDSVGRMYRVTGEIRLPLIFSRELYILKRHAQGRWEGALLRSN